MIKNYFKIARRNLERNKSYALINVAGLALSMTCTILIFVLVKHHLSFDNFHRESDRIYRIVTEMHRETIAFNESVPAPLGKVFRDEHTFGEITARIVNPLNTLITIEKGNEVVKIKEENGLAFAENDFFEIFNFPLLQGDKNSVLSAPNTAIITQNIANKYFGKEDAIGKQFMFDNRIIFTVTGILKNLPTNTDRKTEIYVSYITLPQYDDWLSSDDSWGGIDGDMQCYTRLRPNILPSQVENALAPYVKKYRPESKNVHHYKLQPLSDIHFSALYGGPMEKKNLWILSIIGLFLIVTASVNFINLATAQALKRSKEVGLRKVLGGLKAQLYWQFIAETAIISSVAILLSIMLSYFLLPFANQYFDSQIELSILNDKYLLPFIIAMSVVVTFLAGSYPGLILAGFQPVVALKGKLSQQNIGGFNTRRTLIVAQFAISQLLIIGMVVIINQMRYAKQSDLGFEKEAIVMVGIGQDTTGAKMQPLKQEFAAISGVEKVSLCRAAPAADNVWRNSIRFDNQADEVNFGTSIKAVDEDYLSIFGLELIAGRNLLPSDTVKEFLVNESLTRKLNFNNPQEAMGKMISADGGSMVGPIVGIIKDFHEASFHDEINPVALSSYKEDYYNYAIKINMANAQKTLNAIETAWVSKHPDQIFEYEFLDDSIAEFYATEDRMLKLIQIFSLIAIFIGCLGLYGLASFMVAQKTKEIGIRKVLGGGLAHVLWIFGKEFSRLIVIAILISAPIGWWLMNGWLQDFEFRIQINAWTFVGVLGLSTIIAFMTVSAQVLKAAMMNPVKSLRD